MNRKYGNTFAAAALVAALSIAAAAQVSSKAILDHPGDDLARSSPLIS